MSDLFWPISCFDAGNALPYVAFDKPLRPMVSVARAKNRIRHIMRLVGRNILAADDLMDIKKNLKNEMGIDLNEERWGVDDLVMAFGRYELYLPIMFEVVPYDCGKSNCNQFFDKSFTYELFVFRSALCYVYGRCEFDLENFRHVSAIFERLINVVDKNDKRMVRIVDNEDVKSYELFGSISLGERLENVNYDIKCVLYLPNVSKQKIMDVARVLRGDTVTSEDIDDFLRSGFDDINEKRVYDMGNYGVYEALPGRCYMSYSLLRRGFLNEIEFDSELCGDVLAKFREMEFDLRSIEVYLFWFSFSVAIGLPVEVLPAGPENDYGMSMPIFILGPNAIANYERVGIRENYDIYSIDRVKGLFAADSDIKCLARSAKKEYCKDMSLMNKRRYYDTFEEIRDDYEMIMEQNMPDNEKYMLLIILYCRYYAEDYFVEFLRWKEAQ